MLLLTLVFALNVLGIHFYLQYARRQALLDTPNARSSHETPTVRGGGLLFAPTFAALLLLYAPAHYPAVAAILLAAGISFLDDIYTLPVRYRLPAHFLSVALLLYDTQAGWPPWAWVLALILITGWLNTVNFMDGINGMAGLYGCVLLLSFYAVTENPLQTLRKLPLLEFGMIAALLAFLLFNFRKRALCFAGDIGSVSLALILAYIFLIHWQGPSTLYLLIFPALYAVDSVMTILVRLSRGENIFEAHRTHLYQLLANEHGWDHRIVSLVYGGLQLGINLAAIYYWADLEPLPQLWSVVTLYLMLCGAYFLLRRKALQTI